MLLEININNLTCPSICIAVVTLFDMGKKYVMIAILTDFIYSHLMSQLRSVYYLTMCLKLFLFPPSNLGLLAKLTWANSAEQWE